MTGKNNTVILNGAKRNEESLKNVEWLLRFFVYSSWRSSQNDIKSRIGFKILRRLPIGTPQNDRESVIVILTRRRRGRISKNMKEKF